MDYSYEEKVLNAGYKLVCGIDEAGRGPLAGPVYAAAVVLPLGLEIEELNDSKKLSEKKREQLFDVICEKAVDYSIGIATEQEIDEINILNATFLAMHRAVEGLKNKPDYALIDGNRVPKGIKIPWTNPCPFNTSIVFPSFVALVILLNIWPSFNAL